MEAIFYAEFDIKEGPKIITQVPREELTATAFDSISDFVIPNAALCGSVITVLALGGKRITSFPLRIKDKGYERNHFFFTFGMVFDSHTPPGLYSPVLRKLANVMQALELESFFLSGADTKPLLRPLLSHIYSRLRASGECVVPVNGANTIALKLIPRFVDPPTVNDHDVPMRTDAVAWTHCTTTARIRKIIRGGDRGGGSAGGGSFIYEQAPFLDVSEMVTKEWDVAIQNILPHIDGVKHTGRIAEDANMDVALVKRALRQLLYYDCIVLLDIFQYSNRYTCTEKLVGLFEDVAMQRECVAYVQLPGKGVPLPRFDRVLGLYCAMTPFVEIGDVCTAQDSASCNVDERRLVAYGLMTGIIRRVHMTPILADNHQHHPHTTAVHSHNAETRQQQQQEQPQSLFERNVGQQSQPQPQEKQEKHQPESLRHAYKKEAQSRRQMLARYQRLQGIEGGGGGVSGGGGGIGSRQYQQQQQSVNVNKKVMGTSSAHNSTSNLQILNYHHRSGLHHSNSSMSIRNMSIGNMNINNSSNNSFKTFGTTGSCSNHNNNMETIEVTQAAYWKAKVLSMADGRTTADTICCAAELPFRNVHTIARQANCDVVFQ